MGAGPDDTVTGEERAHKKALSPSLVLRPLLAVDVGTDFSLMFGTNLLHVSGIIPAQVHQNTTFPHSSIMFTGFCGIYKVLYVL